MSSCDLEVLRFDCTTIAHEILSTVGMFVYTVLYTDNSWGWGGTELYI